MPEIQGQEDQYNSQLSGENIDLAARAVLNGSIFQITIPTVGWSENNEITISDDNIVASGQYCYLVFPEENSRVEYEDCSMSFVTPTTDGSITVRRAVDNINALDVSIVKIMIPGNSGYDHAIVINISSINSIDLDEYLRMTEEEYNELEGLIDNGDTGS